MHLLLSNQQITGKANTRVVDLLSREEPAAIVHKEISPLKSWEWVCLLQPRRVYLKTRNCPVEAAGEVDQGI